MAGSGEPSPRQRLLGRPGDCAVNVSALLTLDRSVVDAPIGALETAVLRRLDDGLRLVLSLQRTG